MRVAIIDDDNAFAAGISAMLGKLGIQAQIISPGRGALQTLRDLRVDLLMTDVLMPEVDGLEVIREVRRWHPGIPVIAMSGGGAMLPAHLGLQLSEASGASKVIVKPFTRAELRDVIAELVPSFGVRVDC